MQVRWGTFSNSLLCCVVVSNAFGLICKPSCKLLSGDEGICGNVGCSAAAESLISTSLHRGRLEAVHILGWLLHQTPCVVVILTKLSSLRISFRWVIWSQSNFWNLFFLQCSLWVVSVLNRWKEVHVKGMNGLSKSLPAQSWSEEIH